jgi:broad specificity phosphatase PhoE
MTVFHLVRHGKHAVLGRVLTGRGMDVGLSDEGHEQAAALGEWFGGRRIAAVVTSPLVRTVDTAKPIAEQCGVALARDTRLLEINFGEWAGKAFADLDPRDDWKRWNGFRSGTRATGGETMIEAQARIVAAMQELRDAWPDAEVALVTHGDMIKSAAAYWLGVPLDLFRRIEIDPASISQIRLDSHDVSVLRLNWSLEAC